MKVALTIAGSDSAGAAGVQADLLTFAAHGLHGASAITAVTVQDSARVHGVVAVAAETVAAQVEAVASDMPVAAVKTGMLASAATALAVAEVLRRHALPAGVVDPVLVSSSGTRLFEGDLSAYDALFALAAVVTPNLDECAALLGTRPRDVDGMSDAALRLGERGARAVVVKGGHLEGAPVDVLWDGRAITALPGERVDTPYTRGTGCTFASALAARLALGDDLATAARAAKAYVTASLRRSYSLGAGGTLGRLRG